MRVGVWAASARSGGFRGAWPRFVEEFRIFREESDEGLVGFEFVAELGVHLDAGVGGDGIAGFGAACAERWTPAYLFAVHGGEVTAAAAVRVRVAAGLW